MELDKPFVKHKIENTVATVTFFHPKSNSLPSLILQELADTFELLSNHKEVNVIILESRGDKAFCSGASFDELVAITNFEDGKNFFMGFAKVINAMRKCEKFIIAKIHNKAIGGGVGLAASADYTLAVDYADVRLSEFALGIGPFVVGPAVERRIGTANFSFMSTDADYRTPQWAKEHGLYTEIYQSKEDLEVAVNELASKLSKMSMDATKELKKIFWQGCENWDSLLESRAEISGRLILSDFSKNYIKQFKNK